MMNPEEMNFHHRNSFLAFILYFMGTHHIPEIKKTFVGDIDDWMREMEKFGDKDRLNSLTHFNGDIEDWKNFISDLRVRKKSKVQDLLHPVASILRNMVIAMISLT